MPAGSHRFQVGNLWCTVVSDGYVAHPSAWFFPNADSTQLAQALTSRGQPAEQVLSPYTCLLVETGREVLLADAGLGCQSHTAGAIVARLEAAGIRPRDVDTVVFTHAHPDHIGGAVDRRLPRAPQPMFPNARYVIAEVEWDFWMSSRVDLSGLQVGVEQKREMEHSARFGLQVLRHQIELIDRETEVIPGVRAIPAPGHTPGHMALLLGPEGNQLLNLGDAAVHPLHLAHPDWQNGFDLDPAVALATRRSLLERATAGNMHVMAFHFPFPSVGRVAAQNDGWEWTPGW